MVSSLVAFLAVSAVVICTPGQGTALTIRNTLAGGRSGGVATAAGVALGQPELQPGEALRQGLLSNLGNPKMAVFFTSLLPQFAPEGRASFVTLLLLGSLFCGLTFAWLSAYAVAVTKVRRFLAGPVRRALDLVTGLVLVAFGVRLAAEQR